MRALIAFAALTAATSAHALTGCGHRLKMEGLLKAEQAFLTSYALSVKKHVTAIYTAPTTGQWFAVTVSDQGWMCIVDQGTQWMAVSPGEPL